MSSRDRAAKIAYLDLIPFLRCRAEKYTLQGPVQDRIVEAAVATACADPGFLGDLEVDRALSLLVHRIAKSELVRIGTAPKEVDPVC